MLELRGGVDSLRSRLEAAAGRGTLLAGFSNSNRVVARERVADCRRELSAARRSVDARERQQLRKAMAHRGFKIRQSLPQTVPFDERQLVEGDVLLALGDWLSVPATLLGHSVHSYLPGAALAERPDWHRTKYLQKIARFMARLAQFSLPPELAAEAPAGSEAFLQARADYVRSRVAAPLAEHEVYGPLLAELGVPGDLMDRFEAGRPRLRERPAVLLHGDLHLGNVIIGRRDRLRVVDWELAAVGDPLHDLAVHLERTPYRDEDDRGRMVALWKLEMGAALPGAAFGVDRDLGWYRGFQQVRSLYPDVVRAVEAPGVEPEVRAERIERALRRAYDALQRRRRPRSSPDHAEVLNSLKRVPRPE